MSYNRPNIQSSSKNDLYSVDDSLFEFSRRYVPSKVDSASSSRHTSGTRSIKTSNKSASSNHIFKKK